MLTRQRSGNYCEYGKELEESFASKRAKKMKCLLWLALVFCGYGESFSVS
jgi:hypothetical protein